MCGIAGIWNLNGSPIGEDAFIRFVDTLTHRGPDGRGVWMNAEKTIALGHRRLAIIDLSENGDQPMHYADNRYHIVFNGEIYNFIEIREELKGKGYTFKTDSDTEVIMAAWHAWGENMLFRFNGMWAIALYDEQEQSCFIARDRFGIKPFLYQYNNARFAFASELKSFKSLEGYVAEIDSDSAVQFLKTGFGVEASSHTMLKGISKLQAGFCGWVRKDGIRLKQWWNTLDHLVETPHDLPQQAERFRELFYDAVKLRMRSDVPVGSSLSGGFDSSAIVSALAELGRAHADGRMASNWQQTFVATFPGKSNDERPQAEEVIRYTGVKGHFFEVKDEEALSILDKVLYDFDDVYVGMPVSPWFIYRELRKNKVVVSLDGHGADELIGAYLHADGAYLSSAPSWIGHSQANIRLLQEYRKQAQLPALSGGMKLFRESLPQLMQFHPDFRLYRQLSGNLKQWKDKYRPPFWNKFITPGAYHTATVFEPITQAPKNWDEVNRKLYTLFHVDVLPTILRNFDRMSMAHGIEIRMPFMDWRLVTYAFSLPGSSKVNNGFTKLIAREAMKGHMPESIRSSKTKIGFNAPMPEWFSGAVYPWLMEQLNTPSALVDTNSLRKEVENIFGQKKWNWSNTGNVWKYIHYLWFEKNFIRK